MDEYGATSTGGPVDLEMPIFELLCEDEEAFFNELDFSEFDDPNVMNEPTVDLENESSHLSPSKSTVATTNAPIFVTHSVQETVNFVQEMRNPNTLKKTEQAVRQFERFLISSNSENRNFWEIPPTEHDPMIGSFLLSIRKADGTDYEPDTLTSYHRGLDRCLRDNGYAFSIINDRDFAASRAVLAAKRKELKSKGKGNRPHAAEPLTTGEEQLLREKRCIGTESPQKLLNQVWLNNTVLFGLRGGTENHKLRWGDITLKHDENGLEFLEYSERLTKTRTGEKSSYDQRAFKPKQFEHTNKETCPVFAFKEFSRHRPVSMWEPESPFYLAIHHKRRPESNLWYKKQPLGKDLLQKVMSKMAETAGIKGKKTNHSARKTTCTKLLHAGVAPTTIQQLTGHKNVQSINNYAKASNDMQKEMSNILSNNEKIPAQLQIIAPQSPSPFPSTVSKTPPNVPYPPRSTMLEIGAPNPTHMHPSILGSTYNQQMLCQSATSGHVLQGSRMVNCTINVYNKYSRSPSPKRRRVRMIIDSDSD